MSDVTRSRGGATEMSGGEESPPPWEEVKRNKRITPASMRWNYLTTTTTTTTTCLHYSHYQSSMCLELSCHSSDENMILGGSFVFIARGSPAVRTVCEVTWLGWSNLWAACRDSQRGRRWSWWDLRRCRSLCWSRPHCTREFPQEETRWPSARSRRHSLHLQRDRQADTQTDTQTHTQTDRHTVLSGSL